MTLKYYTDRDVQSLRKRHTLSDASSIKDVWY